VSDFGRLNSGGFRCGPPGCHPYHTPFPCLVCTHAPTLPPLSSGSPRAPAPYSLHLLATISPHRPATEVGTARSRCIQRQRACRRLGMEQIDGHLHLTLASPLGGSIFLQHQKDRCSEGMRRSCGCVLASPRLHFRLCILVGIPLMLASRSKVWTEAGWRGTCRQRQG
jgi:hypothetical protein